VVSALESLQLDFAPLEERDVGGAVGDQLPVQAGDEDFAAEREPERSGWSRRIACSSCSSVVVTAIPVLSFVCGADR
jgi:hypothetical protein